MPDIGFGEIIAIVVVALLVFGPDRLPKVAADAARTLRQVRQMAASARKDLVDAAGLEDDGEMAQTVRDLRDLDPRRAMQGVLADEPTASRPTSSGATPGGPANGPATSGPVTSGPATSGPATAERAAGEVRPATSGLAPVAPPVVAPAPVDPDWT